MADVGFYRKGQWFTVHKSQQFSTSTAKPETDLTVDMLTSYAVLIFVLPPNNPASSGSWKTSTYKKYNFEAAGIPPTGGALHPLLKVREEIRNIFLEMGYVSQRPPHGMFSPGNSVSQRCLHPPSSSPASGASTPSSCPNSTPRAKYKTPSTSPIPPSRSPHRKSTTTASQKCTSTAGTAQLGTARRGHTTSRASSSSARTRPRRPPRCSGSSPRRAAGRARTRPPRPRCSARARTRARPCQGQGRRAPTRSGRRSYSPSTASSATRPWTRRTWPSFTRSRASSPTAGSRSRT